MKITCPIVYGNTADLLSDKKGDHTHIWTCFIRSTTHPLSSIVKKVVFKLHETYPTPSRIIDKEPFEVTETGWGEFVVIIKLYFDDEAGEKPLSIAHPLRIHSYAENTKVESLFYDEIVFSEPSQAFHQKFSASAVAAFDQPFTVQYEQNELDFIHSVTAKAREESQTQKELNENLALELTRLRKEISGLEEEKNSQKLSR